MAVKVRKRAPKRKQKKQDKPEVTAVGKLIRSLGRLGGGTLGGMIGHPAAGADLGSSLAGALSKWIGFGDYKVASNSLVNLSAGGSIANMHKKDQSVVIRHREYLGPLKGSISFRVQHDLHINPGNPGLFPWLSKIATSYQQYHIRGMVIHYVPTSGNAVSSTNAALGSVMFQTSYLAGDAAPVSKAEMMNEYWANQTVPSSTAAHPLECAASESMFKIKLVRENEPVPVEKNLYDHGQLFIATEGMQADDKIVGDLWCVYEIELKKPVVRSTVSANLQLAGDYFSFASGYIDRPWGSTRVRNTSILNGYFKATSDENRLTCIIPGTYIFTIDADGTGYTAAIPVPLIAHPGEAPDTANVIASTQWGTGSSLAGMGIFKSGSTLYIPDLGAAATVSTNRVRFIPTTEAFYDNDL